MTRAWVVVRTIGDYSSAMAHLIGVFETEEEAKYHELRDRCKIARLSVEVKIAEANGNEWELDDNIAHELGAGFASYTLHDEPKYHCACVEVGEPIGLRVDWRGAEEDPCEST